MAVERRSAGCHGRPVGGTLRLRDGRHSRRSWLGGKVAKLDMLLNIARKSFAATALGGLVGLGCSACVEDSSLAVSVSL